MRLINRKRSEKTVVAVRLGRKRRAEWPLLKQLARDNNHGDAFNSIPCTLQSPPGLCDMQAWNNPEGLVVKFKTPEESCPSQEERCNDVETTREEKRWAITHLELRPPSPSPALSFIFGGFLPSLSQYYFPRLRKPLIIERFF
uniref:Uncharacterized protein n=1 Tax=Mus spicilegus TaxID=10103 RepID=A0A8C6I7X1_MUSSI